MALPNPHPAPPSRHTLPAQRSHPHLTPQRIHLHRQRLSPPAQSPRHTHHHRPRSILNQDPNQSRHYRRHLRPLQDASHPHRRQRHPRRMPPPTPLLVDPLRAEPQSHRGSFHWAATSEWPRIHHTTSRGTRQRRTTHQPRCTHDPAIALQLQEQLKALTPSTAMLSPAAENTLRCQSGNLGPFLRRASAALQDPSAL